MKILLTTLNAKYSHPNLALKDLYITSMDKCELLEMKEYTINHEMDSVFIDILQGGYDVVCFSCYVWNIDKITALADDLKKASPKMMIVLGGPEVSYESEAFMEANPFIDIIIRGEGEYTFRCLCQILQGEQPLDSNGLPITRINAIRGLTLRMSDGIVSTPPADELVLESIPFPYNYFMCEDDKVVYYESSRGCPFKCSYCMSSMEDSVRAISFQRVRQNINYFLYREIRQVKFIDRTFNFDKERCYRILKYIIEKDKGTTAFQFEICGDLIDADLLALLENAREGLFRFEIGIQSVNSKTLRAIHRTGRTGILLENIQKLTALGNCHIHLDIIAGLPFEDYNSFKETFNTAYNLSPNMLQMGFLKLLKGTELRKNASLHGYVYRDRAPYEVISNKYISAEDLARLKQIEHLLDLYYNRGGFKQTLEYLTQVFARSPFDFFEELSIFWGLKEYYGKLHKKEDLYRILYQYALWKGRGLPGAVEEIEYILLEDMQKAMNEESVTNFKKKGWKAGNL